MREAMPSLFAAGIGGPPRTKVRTQPQPQAKAMSSGTAPPPEAMYDAPECTNWRGVLASVSPRGVCKRGSDNLGFSSPLVRI